MLFQEHDSLHTFKSGAHPDERKELSCSCPIERMPFTEVYYIPLGQHIGAPAKAIVRKGQHVQRGECIAEPSGFVSVAHHSPVDGVVKAIEPHEHPGGQFMETIVIEQDRFSPQIFRGNIPDFSNISPKEFTKAVQYAGIVGLGGAAFPSHVKFTIPEGKKCRFLLLNGCECEPYLTADHRIMLERPAELFAGIKILLKFTGAEKVFIGIEANKPDAIEMLHNLCNQQQKLPVEVIPLQVKYPQGAEKMLISAILKKEIPSGKLPVDVESVVANVGTTVATAEYFHQGKPLIERVVTITGSGIKRPANLMVPIGTRLADVIEFCGGLTENASRVLSGGPMMGVVQKNLDVPVMKGTSGILVLTGEEVRDIETHNCIRCGRCVEACPIFLNPSRLGLLSRKKLFDEMQEENLMDCIECGSCSFVCPSGIPLVQNFRMAKGLLRQKKESGK
jgi:electron transport complex protein RnfC